MLQISLMNPDEPLERGRTVDREAGKREWQADKTEPDRECMNGIKM